MTTTALDLTITGRRALTGDLVLIARQLVYEQRSFWRNRTRAFFAFLLPLMFLFIFATIDKHSTLPGSGGISADYFVIPGLLAYGVILATFMNLAIELAASRDSGVLKRMRGTPLPSWVFLGGRIASAVVTAALLTALTLTVARLAYGVHVRVETLPGLISALVVGTACFSALGIAVNRVIPNADAAPAVANAAILPLTFFSGVWGTFGGIPSWLHHLAQVFPVQHLANAMQVAFDPRTVGSGIVGHDLLVLAVWGVGGSIAGARYLQREKRRG
jgi:ABC-2 type transport system permease protein